MREINASALKYEGAENETATVTVQEHNTNHSVNYTLDGVTKTLHKGEVISFPLRKKPGDAPIILQISYGFTGPSGGSYEVVVSHVEGYTNGQSRRVWAQVGSAPDGKTYSFFAV